MCELIDNCHVNPSFSPSSLFFLEYAGIITIPVHQFVGKLIN